MSQRIAVAVVHGIGVQDSDYAEPIITELTDRLARQRNVGFATDRATDSDK